MLGWRDRSCPFYRKRSRWSHPSCSSMRKSAAVDQQVRPTFMLLSVLSLVSCSSYAALPDPLPRDRLEEGKVMTSCPAFLNRIRIPHDLKYAKGVPVQPSSGVFLTVCFMLPTQAYCSCMAIFAQFSSLMSGVPCSQMRYWYRYCGASYTPTAFSLGKALQRGPIGLSPSCTFLSPSHHCPCMLSLRHIFFGEVCVDVHV